MSRTAIPESRLAGAALVDDLATFAVGAAPLLAFGWAALGDCRRRLKGARKVREKAQRLVMISISQVRSAIDQRYASRARQPESAVWLATEIHRRSRSVQSPSQQLWL